MNGKNGNDKKNTGMSITDFLKQDPSLKDIPEEKLKRIISRTQKEYMVSASFESGPLPSPEVMEGYSKILPTAPERILKMAEIQSGHRQKVVKIMSR